MNSQLPKPVHNKWRNPCPFYGFDLRFGLMSDCEGNQCGLRSDRKNLYPCQMETSGKTPSWNDCELNTQERREEIECMKHYQVLPSEFRSDEEKQGQGIPLGEWITYIESIDGAK